MYFNIKIKEFGYLKLVKIVDIAFFGMLLIYLVLYVQIQYQKNILKITMKIKNIIDLFIFK